MNAMNPVADTKFVPRNLYLRLSRRKSAKYFVAYYFGVLALMIILGILFLNSVYLTRNYISDGDAFWVKTKASSILLKLQPVSAFTGVFMICIGGFSVMNNILVIAHIYAGGLKQRLQYANYVFFIFQIVYFVYSFIALIIFGALISLYPINFVFSFYNLLNSIIYFMLIRRCVRRENSFMLSIRRMEAHKEEFYQEYLSKNRMNEINPGLTNDVHKD